MNINHPFVMLLFIFLCTSACEVLCSSTVGGTCGILIDCTENPQLNCRATPINICVEQLESLITPFSRH